MKALIIAAYDGNLGENRSFTLQINSNECGEIDVKYHTCETPDSDDELTISDLGKTSMWEKRGVVLPEKDIPFMVKHNVGTTLACTEEALMAVIDDTILNFPEQEIYSLG